MVALALVAVAAVAWPALRPSAAPARAGDADQTDAALDAEVERYRAALRAGTVCPRCLAANPVDSRFCAECGTPLAPEPS